MSNLPENFSYSEDHEWIAAPAAEVVGKTLRVGITSVAADRLGEVVFAELPAVGDTVTAGETCGEVESTKSVSDLYLPVAGEIVAVNEALGDNPGAVNEDPYDAGWLIRLRPDDPADLAGLLDAQAYRDQLS